MAIAEAVRDLSSFLIHLFFFLFPELAWYRAKIISKFLLQVACCFTSVPLCSIFPRLILYSFLSPYIFVFTSKNLARIMPGVSVTCFPSSTKTGLSFFSIPIYTYLLGLLFFSNPHSVFSSFLECVSYYAWRISQLFTSKTNVGWLIKFCSIAFSCLLSAILFIHFLLNILSSDTHSDCFYFSEKNARQTAMHIITYP